jgi:S-adenosylmethionine:diacylglycerol 3-amino-3-carboxypropyl transferase
METLTKDSFGEQCADFITKEIPYLDCFDTTDMNFALEKLKTKTTAIVDKRETKLETIATRNTTRGDVNVEDHIPKEKDGDTWFRIYWSKNNVNSN